MNYDTLSHSIQVAELASSIAESLELESLEVMEITFAALYHDIGKEYVPRSILDKPAKLTEDEFELMKMHTLYGKNLLSRFSCKSMQLAAEVALNHHERFDGKGYHQKSYHEVSLAARIVAVADVYSALVSDRVYRSALDKKDALNYISENAGEQFDPAVVAALMRIMK